MIAERTFIEDRKAGLRVVDDQDELPRLVGAMMGAANDVSEHLADVSYPAHVTTFLRKFERLSWGQAGNYRKHRYENPGGWCFFTLAKWVTITKLDKYQLAHIRGRLEADGILFYQPNRTGEHDLEGTLADGRLIWNLHFNEWKPLQPTYTPPKRGGAHPGAGRPKKQQPAIAKLNTEQASIAELIPTPKQQGTIANIDSDSHTTPLQERGQAGNAVTVPLPGMDPGYTQNQTLQCSPAINYSVVAMDACLEGSGGIALEGSVIKGNYEEKEEETYMVAGATQASFFPEEKPEQPTKTKGKRAPSKKKQPKYEALLDQRPELRPLHEMAVSLFGKPMGLPALNWAEYIEQLGDRPVSPEQLQAASAWYQRKYPNMSHSLQAVTGHYPEYEQAKTNRVGVGVASQYTYDGPSY